MATFQNLTGQRFGKLVVLERAANSASDNKVQWLCKCDCGNKTIVRARCLTRKHTRSCGCFQKEQVAQKVREAKKKYNEYRVKGETVYVKLTNSDLEMMCDFEDWDRLKSYCWMLGSTGYAVSRKNGKPIFFHAQIIECSKGLVRDHINRNKLDNRKSNLRIVDYQVNIINSDKNICNTSGVKGVGFEKRRKKWYAKMIFNGKHIWLGYFDDFESAVKARHKAEEKYHSPLLK